MSANWIAADWPAPETVLAGTTLRTGTIESLQLPGEPCWLKQVHGAHVVVAGKFDVPPEADAAVSNRPGKVCVVRTADCLPVLFQRLPVAPLRLVNVPDVVQRRPLARSVAYPRRSQKRTRLCSEKRTLFMRSVFRVRREKSRQKRRTGLG